MSIPQKVTINCKKCNAPFNVTIWNSVNTDLSEDLSEKVISGEFFDAECPECGFITHMEYDVLYHDVNRKVMIWVVHPQTSNYENKIANIKNSRVLPGYKTRMVKDMNGLREKVATLEAGRDDRIIEICKCFLKHEMSQQHPEFKVQALFYTYSEGEEIVFLYDINEKEMHCHLDSSLYTAMEKRFAEQLLKLKDNDYTIYDAKWAESFLKDSNENFDDEIDINDDIIKEEQLSLFDFWDDGTSSSTVNNEQTKKTTEKAPFFKDNPFWILGVSCLDDRKRIISSAEEMSFLSDDDTYLEAQNTLLTPNKRLSAELDWFIETDVSLIDEIKTCLYSNKQLPIENLNALSKLNATINNCYISDETDSFSLGLQMLEIDKQFAELTPTSLCNIINTCRRMAKMADVTETDVSIELNKKRERIRSLVSTKLQLLKESDYIELVTLFAEKYIANDAFNDSGIISDIIDQYELWSKSIMGAKEEKIRVCIDSIKTLDNDSKLNQAVSNLISLIKEWDMYAQPLQVNLAAKGIEDRISRNFAIDIRDLAIFLHNEKGKTAQALEIIEALKVYFAELSEVLKIVSDDADTLNRLKSEKEEYELKKNQNKQADKKYSVGIFGKSFIVPPLCTCCMKPTKRNEHISHSVTMPTGVNTRTTRTIATDMPICEECLKHRNKYKYSIILICAVAIVIAEIIFSLLTLVNDGESSGLIPSAGVAIGVYYLLLYVLKTKELGIEHAARGKSVEIQGRITEPSSSFLSGLPNFESLKTFPDITFTFANWEYAELFREANGDNATSITEKADINTAKSTSFLKANTNHVSTMLKMLAVFAAIAIIIGAVINEQGSTSSYSSSVSPKPSSKPSSSTSSYGSTPSPTKKPFYTASPVPEEPLFSSNMDPNTEAYAKIVSITPAFGISYNNAAFASDVVCECETTDNSIIWVYMSIDEYNRYIDSNASFNSDSASIKTKTFSPYKTIHGVAQDADILSDGLSKDTAQIILGFISIE